jgi:hypothetical protein
MGTDTDSDMALNKDTDMNMSMDRYKDTDGHG